MIGKEGKSEIKIVDISFQIRLFDSGLKKTVLYFPIIFKGYRHSQDINQGDQEKHN